MTRRLLIPGALTPGYQPLDAEQAHYLHNVLRLRAGATIQVFNGTGQRCSGEVIAAAPTRQEQPAAKRRRPPLALELRGPIEASPAPQPRILLAFALLKPQATDEVLRKATELGATDLLPLISARTQQGRQPSADKRRGHWQGIIEAAAAQCYQDHLPQLHEPLGMNEVLAGDALPFPVAPTQRLLIEPTGQPWPTGLPEDATALLIGPEGGWTDEELQLAARHHWHCTALGPLVLRAETAPLAALTWLTASWTLSR